MRKRKFSAELNKAQIRLDGIRSISTPIELGHGYTDTTFEAEIKKNMGLTEEYNTAVATLEGKAANLRESLKNLGKYTRIVLSEVGSKYGYDSVEYEKAGGTRTSDYKKRKSTKKPA